MERKGLRILAIAVLCAYICAVLTLPVAAGPATAEGIPDGYRKASESAGFELYVYEDTLSVILRNKATGELMRSTLDPADDDGKNNKTWMGFMQSGIVLTAIRGTVDTHQVDLVNTRNVIEYTDIEGGFAAKIFFPEWQFGLTVRVTLEGDSLVVSIPGGLIVENSPNQFIGTVSVFPFMGYTYLDSREGYMFIPDGNGALIYLNDKHKRFTTGFSQMIYGNDAGFAESSSEVLLWDYIKMTEEPNKVAMPVFGMAHTDRQLAYLAIVEEGEKRASIEAHPNGVMIDYNRCFARFILRRVYIQPLNNSNSGTMPMVEADRTRGDIKVRYVMLTGDDAGYAGMAVAYRNYLVNNNLIERKDTSYNTRVDFLGADYEPFLLGTRAVTMTTTDNVREMYDYFRSAGIESLLSVYTGWQRGGAYRIPVTSYRADRSIGGTGALTGLIKDPSLDGYRIYLHNDALRVNNKTSNAAFNTARMVNKRQLIINTWQSVYQYFSYLLPERTQHNLNRFTKSLVKKGIYDIALTEMPSTLFSYSRSGNYFSRPDVADEYLSAVSGLSDDINIIMEKPFAYLWKYTGAYLSMPLDSSHFMYQDESVPFMSIVLKGIIPMYSGYVNFEANKAENKLKMIEAGIYPSFYLTYNDSAGLIYTNSSDLFSTLFDAHKDTVVEYDREFRALSGLTGGAFIAGHKKLTDSVSVTVYDNGVRVYVNYGDFDVTLGDSHGSHSGVTVPGVGYAVAGTIENGKLKMENIRKQP